MKYILSMSLVLLFSAVASANAYKCAKMVYGDGWLTDYEYLGNTWGANTKKHGVLSSTAGSSVEKTTSSIDPGVYINNYISSTQYSSSWGECSMLEYHITKEIRHDYIKQNLVEIKKQIALGQGHHIESLAFLSGCHAADKSEWGSLLKENTLDFYQQDNASGFMNALDDAITKKQINGCKTLSVI